MLFETGKETKNEVLFVDQDLIDREINAVISNINHFNKFIIEFNTAHEGMAIEFSSKYTKAILADKFREVAGADLAKYIDSSPKFLRQSLTKIYIEEIEPIYDKAEVLGRKFVNFFYLRCDKWGFAFSPNLIDIDDNGQVSASTSLKTLITSRFTGKSSDVNLFFADKLEQYINLENELREIAGGHQNLKRILSSQCPEWTNQERHEYNLHALVKCIKETGLKLNAT